MLKQGDQQSAAQKLADYEKINTYIKEFLKFNKY